MWDRNNNITIGFGTAALGNTCSQSITWALESGFRRFDTAEEQDYWYNQACVGQALESFFMRDQKCRHQDEQEEETSTCDGTSKEWPPEIFVDTKIPPWELTSIDNIRERAKSSRKTLVGFLDTDEFKYPLDIYYIHAPTCWSGWHPRCDEMSTEILPLRDSWLAMEAIVGIDQSARRIGLSNVRPEELLDIIAFVDERRVEAAKEDNSLSSSPPIPPPRYPDVLQTFADPLYPSKDLQGISEEYGIHFVSYSTLGTQHEGQNIHGLNNPVLDDPRIRRLAKKYRRSVAEVVLSWAIQRNMSVIPRSTRKEHIKQLSNLFSNATFVTESDLQLIDGLELN